VLALVVIGLVLIGLAATAAWLLLRPRPADEPPRPAPTAQEEPQRNRPRAAPDRGTKKPPETPPVAAKPVEAPPVNPPPKADRPDVQAARARGEENLRQIAVAMENFQQVLVHLPPAAVIGPQGKPLYSWRVLLLPFLDEDRLYKEFKLDEPWDSPHNKKLLARMPKVYAPVRGKTKEPYSTYYQVLVGQDAAFAPPPSLPPGRRGLAGVPGMPFNPQQVGRRITDLVRGTSNTLLLVEAAEAVPWTKPGDVAYDPKKPLPKLGGQFPDGFHAAFADGKVYFIPRTVDEKLVRGLASLSSYPDIGRDQLTAVLIRQQPTGYADLVRNWLARLLQKDPAARREAVRALADLARDTRHVKEAAAQFRQALGGLGTALRDDDLQVRRQALQALTTLGPAARPVAPTVLQSVAASDGTDNVLASMLHEDIVATLVQMGPEVVPALVAGLRDPDYDVRAQSADVLMRLAYRDRQPDLAIVRVLEERQRRLHDAMNAGPDRADAPEAVLVLMEALHGKSAANEATFVREQAAAALGRMGPMGHVAVPHLVHLIRNTWAEAPAAHSSATSAVLQLERGSPRAVPGLADFLGELNANAVGLLVQLGPDAMPILVASVRQPNGPNVVAIRALGEIGPGAAGAVPALDAALHDPSPEVRQAAAEALRRIGPAAKLAVPALTELLKRPDPWGRFQAADAILRLDHGRRDTVLPVLAKALQSPDGTLVMEAAVALARHDPANEGAARVLWRSYSTTAGPGMDSPARVVRDLSGAARRTLRKVARQSLDASDVQVRRAAACLVAPEQPEKVLPLLLDAVKNGYEQQQNEACRAFMEMGPKAKSVFTELTKVVTSKPSSPWGGHFFHPGEATPAAALARIDPERAVPVLLKAWRDRPAGPAADLRDMFGAGPMRRAAYEALLDLGPRAKAAVPDLMTDLKAQLQRTGELALDLMVQPDEEAADLLVKIGEPAVAALVRLAQAPTPLHRVRAAEALGRIGTPARAAVPDVLKLLNDQTAGVRRAAVVALGRIAPGDKEVAAALARARDDRAVEVRRVAVRALGEVGAAALPVLSAALRDADEDTAYGAVGALSRLGPPAVPALEKVLQSRSPLVRRLAVVALARIGLDTQGAAAAVLAAARDPDREVRRMAVALLDRPRRDLPAAVAALGKGVGDRAVTVRRAAVFALWMLGTDARPAAAPLARALGDADMEVRRGSLHALRVIGPGARAAVPAVERLLHEGTDHSGAPTLSAEAAATIARIDPDAVATLTRALKDAAYPVRVAAGDALARLGAKAVPALLELVDAGPRVETRQQAIHALGMLAAEAKTIVPRLARLLGDRNPAVRGAAAEALGSLGPAAASALPALRKMAADPDEPARDAAAAALPRINPDGHRPVRH
jgi:HEAT repeat protein